MNIRYGSTNDAAMLAELGAKSFYDAYAGQINVDEVEAYIKDFFSNEMQSAELADPNCLFLIAELDNIPIGYAKLQMNSHHEDTQGQNPMEIARIYFLQAYVGKGLGRDLMKSCIDAARQRNCDTIWLGVWEENHRAIAFYKKWGFKECGRQTFRLKDELHTDLLMELPLVPH